MTIVEDAVRWRAHARVEKWHDDASRLAGLPPYEVVESPGNIVTVVGVTRIWNLMIGATSGAGNDFRNGYARLGVGDGTTAVTSADTTLSATTNKYWKGCDSTFPSVSGATVTFQTTFATGEANFAWNEWAIDNGGGGTGATGTTTSGVFLNHKVPSPSMGTKTSGSWVLSVGLTLS